MVEQKILKPDNNYVELDEYLEQTKVKTLLLVCDAAFNLLNISEYFAHLEDRMGIKVITFREFQPNPSYEAVVEGTKLFLQTKCEMIVAIGGGSAIDVAKCIKLYSNMDSNINYLHQRIIPNDIKLLAMPTTAGTGSEATRYAVIYYEGIKQSVSDYSCIPEVVMMDASVLNTLPEYQRKSTMLDALCHAIESYWSINSTEESRGYARDAIRLILSNKDLYLMNESIGNENMLKAANIAGRAINITQTTAGHAMCYKLTSMYGISHGHAAAICLGKLWPYMLANTDKCIDPRGKNFLMNIFAEIETEISVKTFLNIVDSLGFKPIKNNGEEDIEILKNSVNTVRLKNNPIALDSDAIEKLYRQIFAENKEEIDNAGK